MSDAADFYQIRATTVRLESASPAFREFGRTMLAKHVTGPQGDPDLNVKFDGTRRYRFGTGARPAGDWDKLDAGLYTRPGAFLYSGSRFKVAIQVENGRVRVQGFYRERLDHTLRGLLNRAIEPNNFQQILRHLVLTPLFVLEEQNHGALPLHAGVVSHQDRGLVLLGLSGVGKSTLSLYLALQEGWRLITDNYALFDAERVWGIREPARVNPASLALLRDSPGDLDARVQRAAFGERRTLDMSDRYSASTAVSDVVFLQLGDRFAVEPVTLPVMHAMLLRVGNAVGEFHYHNHMEMCYPRDWIGAGERSSRTRRFLEEKRHWFATVSRRESLALTTNRLRNALEFL